MAVTAINSIPVTEMSYGTVETVTVSAGDEQKKESLQTTSNVEQAVREYFKDIPVMVSVARCESQFRQTFPDGSILRGTIDPRDIGVMQINTGYHASEAVKYNLDLHNLEDNMAYARILYEKKGTQPWNASAKCWNNIVAVR